MNSEKVVAVGMFDGVHCGHRHLLDTLRRIAADEGLQAAVVTFTEHPASLLRPDEQPPALMPLPSRIKVLESAGIDKVITLDFNAELASLTAAEFLAKLKKEHGVRHLLIGFNTKMGSDRVSTLQQFRAICRPLGIKVTQADEYIHPETPALSSTTVRQALSVGDVAGACKLLGRPYRIEGTVVQGNAVGRTIGFPTANLEPAPGIALPAGGVYAAYATVDGSRFPAMVNIGHRPTLDDNRKPTVEAHLLDTDMNLYGKTMAVDFIGRLRDEQKFPSLEALQSQLTRDAAATRALLASK